MSRLTLAEIATVAARLEARPAEELLARALGEFGDRFAIVTSFQVEGMVVLDLARRLDPAVRVLSPGRWWREAGPDKEYGLHHASPSARFERVLTRLPADVTAGGRPRPAAVRG
jgi:hypothetical protein